MKNVLLLIALLAAACQTVDSNPVTRQQEQAVETQFALDQILRELKASKPPVGVVGSAPLSAQEALSGLQSLGLEGTTGNHPSVIEQDGFIICSWHPFDSPYWGQRGYAVKKQTGEVYPWSLW